MKRCAIAMAVSEFGFINTSASAQTPVPVPQQIDLATWMKRRGPERRVASVHAAA